MLIFEFESAAKKKEIQQMFVPSILSFFFFKQIKKSGAFEKKIRLFFETRIYIAVKSDL